MLNFSESALVDADVLLYVTDTVEKTGQECGVYGKGAQPEGAGFVAD